MIVSGEILSWGVGVGGEGRGEGGGAAKGMGHYRRVGWGLGKGFVSQGGGVHIGCTLKNTGLCNRLKR